MNARKLPSCGGRCPGAVRPFPGDVSVIHGDVSKPPVLADGRALRGSTQLGLFVILVPVGHLLVRLERFLSKFNLNSLMRLVAVDVVVGFRRWWCLQPAG